MEDRVLGINLIIDGISYPLTVKASEEPYYRQAARMVNEKLSLYKDLFSGEEGVRLMTMVAIDLALRSAKGIDKTGTAEIMHKINELARMVDNTLKTTK
jgi:cell division protein ZapA (FtsZ GTPase activity inhibitor)